MDPMFIPRGRLYALNCTTEFSTEKVVDEITDSKEALSLLFEFSSLMKEEMLKIRSVSNLLQNFFFCGEIGDDGVKRLRKLLEIINQEHALELTSPFDDCADIEGNVWKEKEVLNRVSLAAILQVHWKKSAIDLPSRVHKISDRVIMIYEGEGFFHYNFDNFEDHKNEHMLKLKIQAGDVLCFPRNFVHSFSTEDSDMFLLSYHSPFLELDDKNQHTITDEVYYPRSDLKKA